MNIIILYLLIISSIFLLLLFNFIEKRTLKLIHWNPHYQCFEKSSNCCDNTIEKFLNKNIKKTDFLSLILFEDFNIDSRYKNNNNLYKFNKDYKLIKNFSTNENESDVIILAYNKRWIPTSNPILGNFLKPAGRPYIIQTFKNQNKIITVIVCYFPHPSQLKLNSILEELKTQINKIGNINKIVFMADTNLTFKTKNCEILKNITNNNSNLVEFDNKLPSCCNDNNGLIYKPDRIFTNFGTFKSQINYNLNKLLNNNNCKYTKSKKTWTANSTMAEGVKEMHIPLILNIKY